MKVMDVLLQSRSFQGIDRLQLREIIQRLELRAFQRNQALWREGEHPSRLGIVLEGRIKRVKHRAIGRDLIIDLPGPGRILGLLPPGEEGEPISVIGLAQGTLGMIDRQDFLSMLRSHPLVAINLSRALTYDRTTLIQRLEEITAGSVEARLAGLLSRLADEEGEEDDDGGIHLGLPLSRQDLADLADTTIETAIRIMSRWNRDGIVLTQRDGFQIPDLEALEERMER
jgi:CRP/FNR family transcriptional regulator